MSSPKALAFLYTPSHRLLFGWAAKAQPQNCFAKGTSVFVHVLTGSHLKKSAVPGNNKSLGTSVFVRVHAGSHSSQQLLLATRH